MPDLVDAYLEAAKAVDAGHQSDWPTLRATAVKAAHALMADAADRHHIEERSVVYLKISTSGWVIDDPTFDSYPLMGYDDGPLREACECDDERECEALRLATEYVELPAADELIVLLQAAAP